MSENLQERPAFCDTPGLSKTSALASQCSKPDSMGQVKPDRPDIRSKALTDTDEKKKRLQKLGLTHKETYQKFFNRIKEANLNDYVKKYQMKMGNKTSTVDKDAWVDGIGGLSKRESKTLKRQLQGHTREGTTTVHKFKKGQPDIQLDPPRGRKKWGKGGVNEDSRDKSKPDPKGRKHPEIKKDSEKAVGLLKKKGIPAKYAVSQYFGDRIYVQRDMEMKAKKIIPKDLHQYVFGTIDNPVQAGFRTTEEVINEYVGTIKKRESVKKHGYPNQNPKKDKYTGYVEGNKKTFAELSTDLLKRAASAAHKDMEKQKDYHDLAAHDGGRTEREKFTKKAAEKREKQATKFSAAAGEKPPKPESQDSRDKRLRKTKRDMYSGYEVDSSGIDMYEVDSSGIDMYDHKRKESEMRKKARETPSSPETQAKLKKARAGEVVDEISTGLLNRAAGAAKKDAATQRDAQDWATRVKGKGHAFGADEAGKKAAKREKQAGKFSAAVDVKQRDTAFKKEDVIDEKESDYADKIAAFKKKGGKVEKQPEGPISKSLFRTTVGREKRRNPGKQATRDTFYDEVEVKELGPIGGFIAKKVIQHVAKKAINKVTSKNEGIFGSTSPKKTRDKLFLARSRDKTNSVNELSKELLQRAEQGAKKKAGQQRAVSDRAASRVGDTSQPPGQNLKSKRADYQAAKKDYQAFKFGVAAKKKKSVDESNKLQADMALDDAGIKSYWEDGKLWVDKKDVLKAEKALSKSFKKGGEPHIYYKGGFLGVWNKKRKLTG